jgi:hypothetical protein
MRPIPKRCDPELFKNLPAEIKSYPRWLVCTKEKVPTNIDNGLPGGVDDPKTWHKFEDVVSVYNKNPEICYAIGYCLTDKDDLHVIDLDECIDEKGVPSPKAYNIADYWFPCYIEFSPSGKGLRFLFKSKPIPGCETGINKKNLIEGIGGIEICKSGHFYTFTGNVFEKSSSVIEDKTEIATQFFNDIVAMSEKDKPKETKTTSDSNETPTYKEDASISKMSNQQVLRMIKSSDDEKMIALINGEQLHYDSYSEAWFALLCKLCFWFNGNSNRIVDAFKLTKMYETTRISERNEVGLLREVNRAIEDWERNGSECYGSGGKKTYCLDTETGTKTPEPEGKPIPQPEKKKPKSLWDIKQELPKDYFQNNNYIIEGVLTKGNTFTSSDPKAGKSCLAGQFAMSLASGKKFMDHFNVIVPGPVLMFSNEEEAASVLARINKQEGGNIDDSIKNIYVHDLNEEPIMLDEDGLKKIHETYVAPLGIKHIIIDIWDNQRPMVGGRNINAYTVENMQGVDIRRYSKKYDINFIIMHHLNKGVKEDTFHRISGTAASRGLWDTNCVIECMDHNKGIFSMVFETRVINCEKIAYDRLVIQKTPELKWAYKGKYARIINNIVHAQIIELYIKNNTTEMTLDEIFGGMQKEFNHVIAKSTLSYHLLILANKLHVLSRKKRGVYAYEGGFIPEPEEKPFSETTTKPDAKPETKPEAKPDAAVEDLFSGIKPGIKPETKPETKPEEDLSWDITAKTQFNPTDYFDEEPENKENKQK